jgi:hypothetical protein
MTSQAHAIGPVRRFAAPISFALAILVPLGCGTGIAPSTTSTTPSAQGIRGTVFGGQAPIVSSKVYLYAAGTSTSGSRSMLKAPGYVLSDISGNFNITNDYTCTAGDQVYVLALGGDAGGGSNAAIGLMSALGPCSGLSPTTFIEINEVTTVGSVYALSSFITSPTAVGADPVGSNAVAAAFANVKSMTDVSTGLAPAAILGGGIVPQTTIYSLANSIAGCINSTGASTVCSSLFTDTNTPTSSNTAQAVINIAHAPANNAAAIYALADKKPPFGPVLTSPPASWAINVLFPDDVLTYHNDAARDGVQSAETTLTTANVVTATFGKLYRFQVDGFLYAGPLFTGGLGMPDGNLHDVVFAATAHGTIYAFDADNLNPSAGYLWKQSMFATGEAAVLTSDYGCNDTTPESSLLGTPVIDRSTGTLYVVSTEKITASSTFTQKIHAISLIDGTEKFGGPTVITATYPGTGDGAVSGVLTFDALKQNQRPALLLANGSVWISWASHCDIHNYHGYVIAYSASDLTKQTVVFNNTPNGSDGGIWMSGGGPSADADGYVYIVSGNGTFDAGPPSAGSPSNGIDYGDGALKFAMPPTGSTLPVVESYFTPSNQQDLSNADSDVGITNPMLFDDPASGTPHLLVESDKTGRIYLINREAMGGYGGKNSGGQIQPNLDLQDWAIGNVIFNNFAYFNKTMYVGGSSEPLRAYTFQSGTPKGTFDTNPASMSPTTPGGGYPNGGVCPVVSANGTASPIVWVQEHTGTNGQAAALRAYDATNLATELYDSNQAPSNADQIDPTVKFTCPVVANGHVFVGSQGYLDVFGLRP